MRGAGVVGKSWFRAQMLRSGTKKASSVRKSREVKRKKLVPCVNHEKWCGT